MYDIITLTELQEFTEKRFLEDAEGKTIVPTDPYGKLRFVVGNEEDFWCFDFAIQDQSIILHASINSETGHVIEDFCYWKIPLAEYNGEAVTLVEQALEWCAMNNVKHDCSGWDQDPFFFHEMVEEARKICMECD